MYQQLSSSSQRQATAQAASASAAELLRQTRTGGASMGSWVAFDDSAQSAMPPLSSYPHTTWHAPSEHLPLSAQISRTAAPAQSTAATTDVPAALSGSTSDQSPASVPAFHTAASGSSSAQVVSASNQIQDSLLPMSLPQTRGSGAASDSRKGLSQAADLDLLHWDGARALGQSASSAAQQHGPSGSVERPEDMGLMAASTHLPAKASSGAVPVMSRASSCRDNEAANPSLSAARPSAETLPCAQQASTRPPVKAGRAHDELQSLKRQVWLCMLLTGLNLARSLLRPATRHVPTVLHDCSHGCLPLNAMYHRCNQLLSSPSQWAHLSMYH